ncbi:DegT/DnrJ/EryC1/StrS family aminotransferase [Planktomarina temperata]|nr:DegT/DnrJ/EryC1/StrS family aminotransferase [bacterium]MDB2458922.1 DegT/DnrJ/EryC1/StrS family aminotransferase [Planktomarina temperata]
MKNIPLFKVFVPPEADAKVLETMHSGYLSESSNTAHFTKLFSEYINNSSTMMVNSCTSALHLSYILSNVGPGKEVITTPLTAIASNLPIKYLGGTIKWADVDPRTGMIDPQDISRKINEKTAAILVLHKDGDLADMTKILNIAEKYKTRVIEDAAHAVGAVSEGRKVGTIGDFTCFSFQAIKQLSTGDGGALSCKSEDDYWKARRLKWFGVDKAKKGSANPWYNDVTEVGYKYDLMEINGAIGVTQMPYIQGLLDIAYQNGQAYSESLAGVSGVELLHRSNLDHPTYWAYTFKADNRDGLIKKLASHGVGAMQIHPRNDKWSIFERSEVGELPGVDEFHATEISIPSGWWVSEDDREFILNIIKGGW